MVFTKLLLIAFTLGLSGMGNIRKEEELIYCKTLGSRQRPVKQSPKSAGARIELKNSKHITNY